MGAAFLWAYWPVLANLKAAWDHEPDYSHGYLVAPLAAYFLWARRATFLGVTHRFAWGGLPLLVASLALRAAGCLWYFDALEGWSLPVWVAGTVLILGGGKLLKWSLPAIAFLGFMIPLPYRAETMLSGSLQRVATNASCWVLQFFGQGAIAEGNVVVIDDTKIMVAEACSGLRIFVSVIALAFVFTVLAKKPWWTKAAVCASVVPVALLANVLRIVATALLEMHVSGEWAHRFSHDVSGWLMLPLAAAALWLVVWYVGKLIVETEMASPHELFES